MALDDAPVAIGGDIIESGQEGKTKIRLIGSAPNGKIRETSA